MPVFNRKFIKCPVRQEIVTHTWQKRQPTEADPELAQVLDLLDKAFHVAFINTF